MMSTDFSKYNEITLDAFLNIKKQNEVALKKKEILDEVLDHYGIKPQTFLFVGYSPCIELYKNLCTVTQVSSRTAQHLESISVPVVDIDSIDEKQYDVVVAFDEYLTFARTDEDQRASIEKLVKIARKCLVTSLRDYKNQDFKSREFSNPVALKGNVKKIYLEHYEYDIDDRNLSLATNYVIDDNSAEIIGPFHRRNLFFKQLAKFSLDYGAENFVIHKNLMYKSIIKKNYEHIITIKI